MIVYKLTNKINGMVYIGQTQRSLEERFKKHFIERKGTVIHHAIVEYGKSSFSKEILGEYDNLKDAQNAEVYFIEFHNSLVPNGYNSCTGGASWSPSDETRNRISKAQKGKPRPWLIGLKHSESAKEKMSAAQRGNIKSRGYKHSEEVCEKRSIAVKKQWIERKAKSPSIPNVPGIHFDKSRGCWMVRVYIDGQRKQVGRFETKPEAMECRKRYK